ncbi:MAG: hypothetical protein M3010_12735, partial [Candidatus Dormibacteraeota bacterium]|nr:hypothetical protein [Candidatus Dormibacteraeota bacterium]
MLASAGVAGGLLIAAPGAAAETGRVSAQYQGYSTASGPDPYSSSKDVHVAGYGGQPVVTGYVRLNFGSLPANSTIGGLRLTLVPNSSRTDNVNTAAAAFEGCLLTAPLQSDGYQSAPPAYDCSLHVLAEPQSNGTWTFDLSPMVAKWKASNTGLALVAYPPPNGIPIKVTPSAWSLAFAHDQTSATVEYTGAPISAPGSATDLAAGQPAFAGSQPLSPSVAPP